ncbi:hypothetical protein [Arthrobacter sp. MW3 TE3886]|uniref:hypothetical protein n=1 Tax=Arthrobacter sp. MW3 TE3886 TaxID=3156254 RepID=UPI003515374C
MTQDVFVALYPRPGDVRGGPFGLRVIGELSIESTARIMNKSPGAIKQPQRRGSGMNHPADVELLGPALMHVRSTAHGPQPTPSGELADLLAAVASGKPTDSGTVSSLAAHRGKRHTRLVIAAAALSLSLGAGATAAVASPDFRDTVQKTIATLVDPSPTRTPLTRPEGSAKKTGAPRCAITGGGHSRAKDDSATGRVGGCVQIRRPGGRR